MRKREKKIKRFMRHKRVRSRIIGTSERPRISIFRSNKNIFAQLIDDENSKTIASASGSEVKNGSDKKSSGKKKNKSGSVSVKAAFAVGELLAERAFAKKIHSAVFDRGGYKYHGVVKSVADGARKGGLKF